MKWPLSGRRRRQDTELPAELVAAIENVGCVFRSFREDQGMNRVPRPLAMGFLGMRPIYLDDHDAVARLLRLKYPALTDEQVSRAQSLIDRRVSVMRRDSLEIGERRRKSWVWDY